MRHLPIIVALIACVIFANLFVPKWMHMLIGIYLGGYAYHMGRDLR